jgi:hypothetical protein
MSGTPLFIASRALIAARLPSLRLLRKEEWQSVYVDPATSQEWIEYPLWDYHGPGPNCLRRGEPSIQDILTCISSSDQDSEVAAAAYHLSNAMDKSKENYARLIEWLEILLSSAPSARVAKSVALAVAWSNADRPFNHRDPVGKGIEQVDADYNYFAGLASRAAAVKAQAEAMLGSSISQKSTSFE